jgi:hypothetical protein
VTKVHQLDRRIVELQCLPNQTTQVQQKDPESSVYCVTSYEISAASI